MELSHESMDVEDGESDRSGGSRMRSGKFR